METTIARFLEKLELGQRQEHANMAVFPIFASGNHSPEYLTLKEALDKRLLTVTEVSNGGSVPELMAINAADMPILLLDGEELSGAKQNRVLNTTILLMEHSETVIPVSCTEQGRWSYSSHEFNESGNIMAKSIRWKKARKVYENLQTSCEFRADQGEVWDDIAAMSCDAGVNSYTGAMNDVFQSKEEALDGYLKAFSLMPGQRGLLVFVNGKVSGFDVLSLGSAYGALHQKLAKSYAMDAYLDAKKGKWSYTVSADDAGRFLKDARSCREEKYRSIGHGWDYRYEGPLIVGSVLLHKETVIHAAFFGTTESGKVGNMAGSRQRRGHRV